MVIPSLITKDVLSVSKYLNKVKNVTIYGESSSIIDIMMIEQHFHQLQTLKIDLQSYSEKLM